MRRGARGVGVIRAGLARTGVLGAYIHDAGPYIGFLVFRWIFLLPVQNFELCDLNARGSVTLVILRYVLRNLQHDHRFQNAVGARFQVELGFAGRESARVFGKAR